MKNISSEILEQARRAESPEALLEIAGANGIELTMENAKKYFEQMHCTELDDNDLDNVAGGCSGVSSEHEGQYEDKNKWLIFSKL